jgi:hypothetical protein
MIIMTEEHLVESPYIEWVGHGYTAADGMEIRPAEYNWHLIFTQQDGVQRTLVVGALEMARPINYLAGGESFWIRFKVGTFLSSLLPSALINRELDLPIISREQFWLKDRIWEIPTCENVDTFVEQLVKAGALQYDPFVEVALSGKPLRVPSRTIRYHFQHSTGLRQNFIHQIRRVQRAVEFLHQGDAPLDIAYRLGYADQPHLTRSLKRFLGYTPSDIMRATSQ